MKTKVMLEKYLLAHPDYWEYENEAEEVERLKSLIQKERVLSQFKNQVGIAIG